MTAARRWWPSRVRARLTLLYAVAFFVAGAVLVGLLNFYLAHALDQQLAARMAVTDQLHDTALNRPGAVHLSEEELQRLRTQYRQDRDHVVNAMLTASLVSLGVVGIVAVGSGWLLAGRALNPLQRITATARRVADRNLHERIALDGPDDELKDLADTFDAMLDRLDRSFDGQRRFVANASHELRTPLTLNRTLIEVTLDDPQANPSVRQFGATLLAINQRHERLIDGLLTLASSEQIITRLANVDLADVARHTTTQAENLAHGAGIAVHLDLRSAPVTGDPVLLERLAQNLIDNAVRYNLSEHGQISVTTDAVDGNAQLTVENTGPVIPAYDIPSLFEPFRRLDTTERLAEPTHASTGRGAGLGLSIVAAVARAHGGGVHAWPLESGGLTVRVEIPSAAAGQPPVE
jgi:signal transduction histidine kinase